jgi:hypothetical protein
VGSQQQIRRERTMLRGMGFMDRAKDMASQHDDKVDQGLDKAGETAKDRFGHDEQVDSAVDQAQQRTGEGDTTQEEQPPPQ